MRIIDDKNYYNNKLVNQSLDKQYTFPTCLQGNLQSKWLTFPLVTMTNVYENTDI